MGGIAKKVSRIDPISKAIKKKTSSPLTQNQESTLGDTGDSGYTPGGGNFEAGGVLTPQSKRRKARRTSRGRDFTAQTAMSDSLG